MALDDAQLAILKTELDTDPKVLGYNTDDPYCASLLNQVGLSSETIPNTSVLKSDVLDTVSPNELSVVPVNELQFFLMRMQGDGSVDISVGSPIVTQALQIFPNEDCPITRAALVVLAEREASRAEVLFGAGVTIRHQDVGMARQVVI